jgi:hypothetical protein
VDDPFWRSFKEQFHFRRQTGETLGDRMNNAFRYLHSAGFQRMIMIGSDCLTIQSKDIAIAFEKLCTYDSVIGPSADGGYYLIGLCKPNPNFFKGIAWSRETVFNDTLARLKKERLTTFFLPEKEDIDTLDSFKRFAQRDLSKTVNLHTADVLANTVSEAWNNEELNDEK